MSKFLVGLLGFLTTLFIPFIGFCLSMLVEHISPFLIAVIIPYALTIYIYKKKSKVLGKGMFIGLLPLSGLLIITMLLTHLH